MSSYVIHRKRVLMTGHDQLLYNSICNKSATNQSNEVRVLGTFQTPTAYNHDVFLIDL